MRLLIYVPARHGSDLASLGLDWFTADGAPGPASVMHGPDGGAGLLYCHFDAADPQNNPRTLGYRADQQDWRAAAADPVRGLAAGRYWLGRDLERPMTPATLTRKQRFRSLGVTLGDGHTWHVPVAQALPRIHSLDEEGRWQRLVVPGYREFCERSASVFAAFMAMAVEQLKQTEGTGIDGAAAREGTLSIDEAREYALDALAIHYHVGRDLADWLGLLTDETLWRVLAATVDLPLIGAVADQKKTA